MEKLACSAPFVSYVSNHFLPDQPPESSESPTRNSEGEMGRPGAEEAAEGKPWEGLARGLLAGSWIIWRALSWAEK